MKWIGIGVVSVVAIALGSGQSAAAPMLGLTSPTDLANLGIGQTATIQVELSGLDPGDEVEFLAATVAFDADVLGTPEITDGAIIPDPTGVLFSESPGLADYSFDIIFSASGTPITMNGVFFSFDVTGQKVGTTLIAFDFVDSFGESATGDLLPTVLAGDPLSARVVPEPSTIALWLAGMLGGCGLARRYARRTARSRSARGGAGHQSEGASDSAFRRSGRGG